MKAKTSAHPPRETLAAFGSGELQPDEAVAVERHIEQCEECCETLNGLGSDTFIDLVRRSDAVQLDSFESDGTVGLQDSITETVGDLPDELAKHPRYRILKLLGKGGMGDVYKAEHTLMNRTVAVKVINHQLVQNPLAVQRFRREVQSAAHLAHSNIVAAYDAEQAGDVHLLVMEYVAGDTLCDVVKRDGPLEFPLACGFIQQASQGLQHAHEKGMVHRDVKPHNLMIALDGQVKILDFGLATLTAELLPIGETRQDSSGESQVGSSPTLTSAGSMMGTPDFISPEQATDARAVDIRSDVYSLGCTFYYLLTGKPPFAEGSALERVKAHRELEPEPIENARPDIPEELAGIVRRMMAKDPAERFQTPAEVAGALAPFVDAHRTTPRQETDSGTRPASSRRSWWPPTLIQSIACGAFAFVLAGIIYVQTNNGMLEIVSDDEDAEIVIRGSDGLRIIDTLTGSTAKRLPSGEYLVDLKGADNDFELSKDRFVLRRGGKVIVRVTRKRADVADRPRHLSQPDEAQNVEHSITERKRWSTEKFVGAGSISRDGRFLPYIDQKEGNVEIRDLVDGRDWFVADRTKDGRTGGRFARSEAPPVISADGQRVAFNWYEHPKGQDGGNYSLRVSNLDGSQSSDLYQNDEVWPQPFDWSADGQYLLAAFHLRDDTSQIVLVSTKDGSDRIIKSLDWRGVSNMKFSNNGRSFVFDRDVRSRRNAASNHDIYLLDPDQNQETVLVEHPADDRLLGWSADRGTVLFSSDRRGTLDLWSVDVINPGKPSLVKEGVGRIDPIGFDADDTFYFRRSLGGEDVYVATVDVESGELKTAPRKVSRFREGENSAPDWSPDGTQLAYVRARNQPRITIFTMETEQYREIYPDLRYMRGKGARWSPNNKSFVLDGTDNKGRRGIYQVDAQSGDTKLIRGETETVGRQPEWTPDGHSIVFVAVRPTVNPGQFPFAIRLWDLATGKEEDIVSDITSRQEPSFALSPDGKSLAFVTHDKGDRLQVVSLSGGEPRTVYQEKPRRIGRIEWARDGSHIVVEKPGENETELWRVSIKDGSSSPLGLSAKGIYNGILLPRIHPDGRQIAFTAADRQETQSEVWSLENLLTPLTKEQEDFGSNGSAGMSNMRRVFVSEGTPQLFGGMFPAGGSMSMVDWDNNGNLAIRELSSGKVRHVTHNKDWSGGYAYYSVPSPDGKRIACCWPVESVNYCQLRVIDVETGDHQILYDNSDGAYLEICSWSPDGENIVVALDTDVHQLILFSVKDGSHRVLKSLDWRWPETASVSPDGRYLVYDLQVHEDTADRNLFIISTDGTSEIELTHPAIDARPVWTPDGRGVVFTSDRSGSEALWYLEVTDGQASNEPELLVPNVMPGSPIGFTTDGSYYVKTRFTWRRGNIYVAGIGEMKTDEAQAPRKAIQHDEGFQSLPCWSPNGEYLAYTLRGDHLVIRDMTTGRERKLRPKPFLTWRSWRPRWTADGKSVVLGGSDSKGRWGLYSVNAQSGEVTPVLQGSVDDFFIPQFDLSPDGTTAYFLRSSNIISRNLVTGQEKTLQKSSGHVHSLALSPDGRQLACASTKVIDVLSTKDGTRRELLKVADGRVIPHHVGITWAAADNSIVFASADAKSYHRKGLSPRSELWKVSTENGTATSLGLQVDGLRQISLHPDGQQIAYTIKPRGGAEVWALDNFLPAPSDAN